MAETSSADTKDQNGKAMRRSGKRRGYPPSTELLQTECESPKKPPVRPFTTDQGGRPIKDEERVDLAIALAKLDLTCLEILAYAVYYGSKKRYDRDTHRKDKNNEYSHSTALEYTAFRTEGKVSEIADDHIALMYRDLLDINRSVSMVISQEYLCTTELSHYWKLLPSAFAFLISISSWTYDTIVEAYRLPVKAEEVRQKALLVARSGALEHEIRTGLRQRWSCIEQVTREHSHSMDHKLREDTWSLNLSVDPIIAQIASMLRRSFSKQFSSQLIAEDRRRQARNRFAEPNARIVLLMWSAFTATLLTAIPTMVLGWRFLPHKQESPTDKFLIVSQNCAMTFLGLATMGSNLVIRNRVTAE